MPLPRDQLQQTLRPLYDHLTSLNQVVTSAVQSGSAVALTTATPANVTSITLTEGDWTVFGVIGFLPTGTTSITVMTGGFNTTSATVPPLGQKVSFAQPATVPGAVGQEFPIAISRLVVPAGTTQTVFLVAQATFTASTMGAYGVLTARLMTK